ncbi:MAG: hypothetical protein ACRES7_12375, partial [Gammaproteobacteria bacterium]
YAANNPVVFMDPSGLRPPFGGVPSPPECRGRAFPEPGCDNWNSCTGDNYGSYGGCEDPHKPLEVKWCGGTSVPCGCSLATINKALAMVNRALNGGGACQEWFDAHGAATTTVGESLSGTVGYALYFCPGWGFLYPTWTYPGANIYFSKLACEYGASALASLIIHEFAHHFCTLAFGRERCAIEAQNACESEL